MKVRPLRDQIMIKRSLDNTSSAGGIVIPDSAADKPSKGEVVAVGSGKTLDNGKIMKPDLKVGETVLFGKFSGTEIEVDNKEYIVMSENDIMAVFDEKMIESSKSNLKGHE